jgi:hypothetical protein
VGYSRSPSSAYGSCCLWNILRRIQRFCRQVYNAVTTRDVRLPTLRVNDKETLGKLWYLRSLRQDKEQGGILSMKNTATLLSQFHTVCCTDTRDKLYALNSLSSTAVPVDYDLSVEETYYRCACAEIIRCPVSLMSCAGAFRSSSNELSTPPDSLTSWAPDWRRSLRRKPLQSSLTDLPTSLQFDTFVAIQSTTIVLEALFVGTITETSRVTYIDPSYRDHFQHFQSFFDGKFSTNLYHRGKHFDPEVADVLTAGAPPEQWTIEATPPLHQQNPFRQDRSKVSKLVESVMDGRVCFSTDPYAFGMGPDSVQEGNIVVSISGGS